MRSLALLSGLMLFSLKTYAYQYIPVQEDNQITAYVAPAVLNRIAAEDDKIIAIKGIQGEFEYEKDLGQIFLKPVLKEKPTHIFLVTEKGHTYSINLVSSATAPESIVLGSLEDKSIDWETSSYESALKEVIKAMHNQSTLEGYKIENSKLKLPKIRNAKVKQLRFYSSQKLQGMTLEVTNKGPEEQACGVILKLTKMVKA